MSEILSESIEYIEQSKVGLLITVGEDSSPYIRSIGAFSNDGANIYFETKRESNKVRHIKQNPVVTFYFQNEGQAYNTFKSVAVTGEASEVLDGVEFDNAVEGISKRYPIIKEQISNGAFKDSSIYKVKAKFVKLADYTKNPKEIKEII